MVSRAPHTFPGIKPLCLALDSVSGIAVGCDALLKTTAFGVVIGMAVAVDFIVGGECRLLRPNENESSSQINQLKYN